MIRREENYGMRSGKSWTLFGILAVAIAGLLVIALPSVAAAKDRNHDRIPDRWEKRHHLSLHVNQAKRDQDRDGLKNRQEFKAGDDPRDPTRTTTARRTATRAPGRSNRSPTTC